MRLKRILAIVLSFAMVLGTMSFPVFAEDTTTVSATADETINSSEDLKTFRDAVNAGNAYEGKTVVLNADIDLTGSEWISIGNGSRSGSSYNGNAFKGTFDGGDKKISGLTAPLFGVVTGTVKDVNIVANINDTANDSIGAAVAVLAGGTVDDADVSGTVIAAEATGGVVGRMLAVGNIKNCDNTATVTSTGSSDAAGGIVGKAYYTSNSGLMYIDNCTNAGAISGGYASGGIAGFSSANISNCSNAADVVSTGIEAGGIVGEQTNYGTISGNTNSGNVTGGIAGGIIGWTRYQNASANYPLTETVIISNNTNTGSISSGTELNALSCAGGIAGNIYNQAIVTGNTNKAASITAATFAGGIVGALQASADNVVTGDAVAFTVTGNTTTTADEYIIANCKDSVAYNNVSANATIENNTVQVITAVAKIGDVEYKTLQDAVNAAKNGDVITVIADHQMLETVTTEAGYPAYINISGKSVTIDLNGKNITATPKELDEMLIGAFYVHDNSNLVLKDSSADMTGSVTINEGVNAGVHSLLTTWDTESTATIESGNYSVAVVDKGQSLIYASVANSITIKGGNFTLGNIGSNGADKNYSPWIFNVSGAGDYPIIVTGGTFNADVSRQYWIKEVSVPKTHYVQDNEDGTWTIKEGAVAYVAEGVNNGPYYAQIDFGYATLQDALNAAMDEAIFLLNDIELSEGVKNPAAENSEWITTLDLAGYTITGTDSNTQGNFYLIDNRGNLTVKDSIGTGKITLTAENDRDWNASSVVIANNPCGKLTVESGTIEHLGGTDMAYGIDSLTNGGMGAVDVTINGGTIKSTYRAIRQFLNSDSTQNTLTINGGIVEGENKAIFFHDPSKKANLGKLTIGENADVNGGVYLFVTEGSTEWPVEVSIAESAVDEVTSKNVPEGYAVVNSNGYYGVSAAAATVNGVGYETVAEAVAVATDGDEVKILTAGTYSVPTGKSITITGAVDGVVFDNIGACGMGGANVTFNNVTFDYYPNVGYTGLQHSGDLVYNNCTFNGQVFLYGNSETFNSCTFNQDSSDAYNVWTYGAKEVTFNKCTFNSAGKSVLIYKEGDDASFTASVNVVDTDFVALSAVEGKAAIEMDSSLIAGINLTIDAATTVTGFSTGNVSGNSLWNNKKGSEGVNNDITVVVNGETVLAPKTYVPELPTATVTEIENEDLTFALNFKADEASEAQLDYYGDWYADYVLTVNKDVTFNSDGTKDGYLSGQYDAWNENWVNVPFEDVTLEANESLKIMEYAAKMLNQSGLKLTYNAVYEGVKDFDCGVYFTDEFLAANPDLVVTLELRMYNNEDESESYVIGKTYTFEAPEYVAKIGDVEYTTLQEAIDAAEAGDTVTLLTDVELAQTITVAADDNITLDMNGKKITASDDKTSGNYEVFYNFGELTITGNGTIELTAATDRSWNASSSIFHNRGGKLTIENGTFTHLGGTSMAYVVDNSANSYGDATTTVNDGTLKSSYIVIRNRMDTYGANGGGNGLATLDINGGIFEGKYAIWGQVASSGVKGNIEISDGKFIAAEGKDTVLVDEDSTGEITTAISGGTYTSDVTAYLASGYEIVDNGDGTYGVQKSDEEVSDIFGNRAGAISVKVTEEGNDEVVIGYRLHLFAGIDSLKYKEVGFEVTVDGVTETICSNKVFLKYQADNMLLTPDMFGENTNYIIGQPILFPLSFKDKSAVYRSFAVRHNGEYEYGPYYRNAICNE